MVFKKKEGIKMEKWTKSQFEIKGRRTGARLANRENEYVYEVFIKETGEQVGDVRFTSKKSAIEWLVKFLAKANKIREKAHEQGLI